MSPKISTEELLADLRRVADKVGHSPTRSEYEDHGDNSSATIKRRFGSWNEAKIKAGLEPLQEHVSDEKLLADIRRVADELTHPLTYGEYENNGRRGRGTIEKRFGNYWSAMVRAGIKPKWAPLSAADYEQYIQTAISVQDPHLSVIGLLRAFTGIPLHVLSQFSLDWVSRLNDDHQPPLLTVPSEYIYADEDWVMIVPTNYTIAGEKQPTTLDHQLAWMKDYIEIKKPRCKRIHEIIDRAGINAEVKSLRSTVVAHLIRRGVSHGEIEMQVGFEKTNSKRSIEDYYLYLFQFEGVIHNSYTPSGVYLDPETGEAKEIETDGD